MGGDMDTKAAQRQLVSLVTQHLSESIPVTRILSYKPNKNGSVTGKFESNGRVFNFAFNGDDARYKPTGNMDSDLFSHLYLERFDAVAPVKSRALPRCTSQSYSCKGQKGVRCLPLTQNCKMIANAVGRERLGKIQSIVRSLANPYNTASNEEGLRKSESAVLAKRKELADKKKSGWKNASEQKEPQRLTKGQAPIDKKRKNLEKKQAAMEKKKTDIRMSEGKSEAYYDLEQKISNSAALLENYSVLPEVAKQQKNRQNAKNEVEPKIDLDAYLKNPLKQKEKLIDLDEVIDGKKPRTSAKKNKIDLESFLDDKDSPKPMKDKKTAPVNKESVIKNWSKKFEAFEKGSKDRASVDSEEKDEKGNPLVQAYLRKGSYFVDGKTYPKVNQLASIEVSEGLRGQGYFSSVIKEIEKRHPDRPLVLEGVSEGSIALAKKNGFTEDSHTVGNWVKLPKK